MRRGRQSEEETKPTKCVSTRKARNIGGRWRVQALQESNAVGVSQQAWIVRDCQSNSHLRSFSCSHLLVKSTAAFLDLFGVDFEGLRQHGVPTSGLPPWPPVHAHRLGALCDWRRAMDSCVDPGVHLPMLHLLCTSAGAGREPHQGPCQHHRMVHGANPLLINRLQLHHPFLPTSYDFFQSLHLLRINSTDFCWRFA